MTTKNKFIFVTRSLLDPYGSGDRRRVAQIMEILERHGDASLITQRDKKIHYASIKLADTDSEYAGYWNATWWLWVEERLKEATLLADQWVPCSDPGVTYIIEDPLFFLPLIRRFDEKNIPYYIHLQNIESLISEHVAAGMQPALLARELCLLARARGVICIAQEEQWLLSQFGINALYLPYYPVQSVAEELLAIRRKREVFAANSTCLITGNMCNTPIRAGCLMFLDVVKKVCPALLNDILVAGFNVKRYAADFAQFGVQMRSDMGWSEYRSLLENVRSCICYQESGGGALCKIPEMLIAGVPIYASTIAARSYHNLPSVFEYPTIDLLLDGLCLANTPKLSSPLAPTDDAALMRMLQI